jgi:hypothetical protein
VAGRLRVRGRQSGQASRLGVRTGKGQNQEGEKKDWKKQELRHKTLVDLNKQTNELATDKQRTHRK